MRESLISTLNEQIQAKQLRREQARSTSLLIDKDNLKLVNQAEREHQLERKVHRATVIKVGKHQLQRSKEVKSQQIALKKQVKDEDKRTIEAQVLENLRRDQERQRRRFNS